MRGDPAGRGAEKATGNERIPALITVSCKEIGELTSLKCSVLMRALK